MSSIGPLNSTWGKSRKRDHSNMPRLPDELKSMILETFQELEDPKVLTWLWVGVRHVSNYFRWEIERIFRTIIMPETVLHCELGLHLLCWDVFMSIDDTYAGCHTEKSSFTSYDHLKPHFTLDRFSDDQTRAFFKFGEGRIPEHIVYRRLHEKHLVGSPVFAIQICGVVNDTALPELQIDDDNGEISFEWRGMLDRLMGEEHVFNTILSQRLGWHLELEKKEPDILMTHRRLARRSRLQRECRAKYGSDILDHYTCDEKSALRRMHRIRRAASDNDDKTVYTQKQISDELPSGTIIFSGNPNPGLKVGSIPRGIFTDKRTKPRPSAADLFSPRPLPQISWGRLPVFKTRTPKWEKDPSQGKRAREEEELVLVAKKQRRAVSHPA